MSTWKVILATLVIFAAGIVTGGLVVKISKKNKPKNVPVQRMEVLRRLTRDLNLSAEQRARINNIIQESNERTKILREIIDPELRAEFKKALEDIRAVLTPEQRARFDQLVRQRQHKSGAPKEKPRPPAPSNSVPRSTNLVRADCKL